jgi:Nuclease-related domain
METRPEPADPTPAPRRLRLRRTDTCVRCGALLAQGTDACYDPSSKTVACLACPVPTTGQEELPIESGVAGRSALRESERRATKREAKVKGRWGQRLGGVMLAVADEPQSTRAWATGARGEAKLAASLAEVPGVSVLHDRRAPGTRGNIDHLVVAPAGVFVVDAKHYKGLIQIRDKGGFFRTDLRLYVGGHDCSKLAANMDWQVAAVDRVLTTAGLEPKPPITPVLCFVEGEWPLLRPPDSFRGVSLESERSIRSLVTSRKVLDGTAIERLTRILATAFPPK